MIVWS